MPVQALVWNCLEAKRERDRERERERQTERARAREREEFGMFDKSWQEWVDKEFITSLKAKGKLPNNLTLAQEQKRREFQKTDRVFPAPPEATTRAASAMEAEAAGGGGGADDVRKNAADGSGTTGTNSGGKRRIGQREVLKRRLNSLQHELQQEKVAYEQLLQKYGARLDETTTSVGHSH